jgi:two-component system, sensor histidine kinase and response regulator
MMVLLADDDEDQLAIRGMLFRHSGFQTLEASDVSAALKLTEAQEPSCALIDLCLPTEQDGVNLVRQIKQLYPAMSVFVLTGRKVDKESYPELQAVDGVFLKGTSIREIISRLQSR